MKSTDVLIIYFYCRYDPNADLPEDTETEQDRVIFIKSVSQFMVRASRLNNVHISVLRR